MKRTLPILLLSLAVSCSDDGTSTPSSADVGIDETTVGPSTPIKVMTFNVMCLICVVDGYEPWAARQLHHDDIYERHDADLLGLQELTLDEDITHLLETHPEYAALYFEHPQQSWPDATILYRTSRFDVVETGFYWLSPTPDVEFTNGFAGGTLFRVVTWARLHDKTDDRDLFFATTHVDNNTPSQEKSVPLLLERTAPFVAEGLPIIWTGDFNSRPDSTAYGLMTSGSPLMLDSFDLSADWESLENAAEEPYDTSRRIDHVFVSGPWAWSASDWTVDRYRYGAAPYYPSDHFPIVVTVSYASLSTN